MVLPTNSIRPGSIVRGPTLPEPVEVLAVVPLGDSLKIIGRGLRTGLTHDPVLTPAQLALLTVSAEQEPFVGDARLFRLGVEAHRLGLAYEYDPFFSLSIARVDPLPHQLEAVYDYFLRLPRIRFLLADDPGAGKTIMAGLLHKELKARGLIRRTLIEVRFIEVKGRAGVGVIALSENEYRTAQRLKGDYWLYTVFNCGGSPELHAVQEPARLSWTPVVRIEHYLIDPATLTAASQDNM